MTNRERLLGCTSCDELFKEMYKKGDIKQMVDDTVCFRCNIDCGHECKFTDDEMVEKWLNMEVENETICK